MFVLNVQPKEIILNHMLPLLSRRVLCATAAAAMLACSAGAALAATPKDTLVLAFGFDDIITMDPAEAFELSAGEIMGNTYDRLLRLDIHDPSKLVGDVAKSWSVSADGKTYTFELKPGLKFASGNPLTAEEVAYSLQRAVMLDKSPAFILTQFGFSKANVKDKIKATSPTVVTLETDKAYAPTFVFNCLTANVAGIVDMKLVQSKEVNGDWGYAWLKTNYAGSGPLKLREWRANEIVALERNDNYYGAKPKLARVIYRHVKESATQRLLLEKGDIDIARNLSPQDIAALSANKDVKLTSTPKGTVYYISLNQKNANLAKPEVREAMKYLIDYDAIGDTLVKNIGVINQNFLPQGLLGASKDKPYKLDVAKAKALLAKAGLASGFKVHRHAHHPAGAGHYRGLPADGQAGRRRHRNHPGRRKADADQVPRPHPRHVHRPVGRRLLGPALERRHFHAQPRQRRRCQGQAAGLAQCLGDSRADQAIGCRRAGARCRQAQEDV
jgi:peptide/nickel transport system substrate-binding protein